ncbi:MAG: hypothetical protein Q9187_006855 [Circinaria calcarea]
MPVSLTVPNEYGYVLLAATASAALNAWHGSYVGSFRKAAKVPYPNAYATATEAATSQEKYRFNCAVRAHAHFIEAQPSFLATLLIAGLKYPVASAGMGFAWVVARAMFTYGYTRPGKENGKGRYLGIWHFFPVLGLMGMSVLSAYGIIVG